MQYPPVSSYQITIQDSSQITQPPTTTTTTTTPSNLHRSQQQRQPQQQEKTALLIVREFSIGGVEQETQDESSNSSISSQVGSDPSTISLRVAHLVTAGRDDETGLDGIDGGDDGGG